MDRFLDISKSKGKKPHKRVMDQCDLDMGFPYTQEAIMTAPT